MAKGEKRSLWKEIERDARWRRKEETIEGKISSTGIQGKNVGIKRCKAFALWARKSCYREEIR
jgi:hypothetical protein